MSSPYFRGRRFEYRVQRYLRKLGWFVVRQPRSRFPDLIALKSSSIALVECKLGGSISRKERRALLRLAKNQVGGRPILASRNGTSLVFKEIRSSYKYDRLLVRFN